jgi:hypothetical protein
MISQELCAEKNLTSYVSLCFSDKYLTTKKQTRHVNKRKAKTTKKNRRAMCNIARKECLVGVGMGKINESEKYV